MPPSPDVLSHLLIDSTMSRKGVVYDAGCGWIPNMRPDYAPALVHRELEIIRTVLHCNAVRIRARDIGRLTAAAEDALRQGLEIDWDMFDLIGINHYWREPVKDRYLQTLEPLLASGKPVVVAEMGFRTRAGADQTGSAGPENIDPLTMVLHMLPLTRRFVRPRVKTVLERDEELQARSLRRQLELLDSAGVGGTFVYTFTAPLWPHGDDPRHDLDADSFGLVKPCPAGRHGTAYPDMAWEPKKSFTAVADYYATR
jgi:hypothetical protein